MPAIAAAIVFWTVAAVCGLLGCTMDQSFAVAALITVPVFYQLMKKAVKP